MPVTVTRDDAVDHVAHLRIDAGELNLFGPEVARELRTEVESVPADVSVLTIRGQADTEDGGLTAGIPLDRVVDYSTLEAREMLIDLYGAMDAVRNAGPVTVCGCGSYALGAGLELAMACDFRIAKEDAVLGLPEIDVGLVTGIQGGLLIRLVGLQTAKELIYTGETVSGSRAEEIDLVNRAVPDDAYGAAIDDVVDALAAKSPIVLRWQKQVFAAWRSGGIESGIDASLETIAACFGTDDQSEAMAAFLEDREPSFEGR